MANRHATGQLQLALSGRAITIGNSHRHISPHLLLIAEFFKLVACVAIGLVG